jgi:hypothetical protein
MPTPPAIASRLKKLRLGYYSMRYLGLRFLTLRVRILFESKLGMTQRRFEKRPWDSIDLKDIVKPGTPTEPAAYAEHKRGEARPFLFKLGSPPDITSHTWSGQSNRSLDLEERLALLEANRCIYFFTEPSPEPINWHVNPFQNHRSDPSKKWCDIPDYLPNQGDPRMMWEPSRAAWALDIMRGAGHGRDPEQSTDLFWQWVDSWMGANEPWQGFQWKCGQESSVRLVAILLGFYAVGDQKQDDARWQQMARLAWATGYRVVQHLHYAVSQKNNHAISEACALMLIAHLFPELKDSATWWKRGREVFVSELKRQTYADGSYCQQSTNYQRVMMQGAMMIVRLAELAEQPFERDIYDLLGQCAAFMHQLTDPTTGEVPQYGHNDGAWILPLDECGFWDFRPVVQSVWRLVHGVGVYPPGPWDEDSLWLFGTAKDAPSDPEPQVSSRFDVGGYYTLRQDESWLMTRCHSYVDRVGHDDPLHIDLWYRGVNVLRDNGTFRYYQPGRPDLESYFSSIAAHSSIELDDKEPMQKFSRFQRFPFTKARVTSFSEDALTCVFEGYRGSPWKSGWKRSTIALGNGAWLIADELKGKGEHTATIRWQLADLDCEFDEATNTATLSVEGQPYSVHVSSEADAQSTGVYRGVDEPGRILGWASTIYGKKHPIPVLESAYRFKDGLRLFTVIGPGRAIQIGPMKAGSIEVVIDGVSTTVDL